MHKITNKLKLNPVFRLIAVLDQVEMRVERLRRDTIRIEEERDSLLSTLDSIKHSELLGDVTDCKLSSQYFVE